MDFALRPIQIFMPRVGRSITSIQAHVTIQDLNMKGQIKNRNYMIKVCSMNSTHRI